MGSGWITAEQLKKKFHLEDFEILQAIDKGNLHAFNQWRQPIPKSFFKPVIVLTGRPGSKGEHAQTVRSQLPGCIFKIEEVSELKNSFNENASSEGKLSCNSMAGTELFCRAIKAAVDLAIYCEKNQPVIKTDALDFLDSNFPELRLSVLTILWQKIPTKYKQAGRPKK